MIPSDTSAATHMQNPGNRGTSDGRGVLQDAIEDNDTDSDYEVTPPVTSSVSNRNRVRDLAKRTKQKIRVFSNSTRRQIPI